MSWCAKAEELDDSQELEDFQLKLAALIDEEHESLTPEPLGGPRHLAEGVVVYAVILVAVEATCISLLFARDGNITKDKIVLLACCIAPVGALLRYHLAFFNKHWPYFPLFTWIPNMFAASISLLISILLDEPCGHPALVTGEAGVVVLQAVSVSFDGSLSTISSFVNEVVMLKAKGPKYAFLYTLATLAGGQLLGVAMLLPFYLYQSVNLATNG